jgi:hypothetical protein
MWPAGILRVLPTAASVLSLVSDSTADVATSGTGGWTVTIEGLDVNYVEISETLSLNGTTPVAGSLSFFRVNRAFVITAGSGEVNAGNLSVSISGAVQGYVEATEGQSHQVLYTVPANHTLLVVNVNLAGGRLSNADAAVLTQIKDGTVADSSWRSLSDLAPYEGQIVTPGYFASLGEKTEIRMVIVSTATNAEIGGEIHGFLVRNDKL